MESITAWFKVTLPANLWIIEVFVVVFAVLLLNFIQRRVLSRLYDKLKPTENTWDDALVDAMRHPLTLLIWIVGIAFAAQIVQAHTSAVIFNAFGPARDVGVIATIVWFLLRLIRNTEENIIQKRVVAEQTVDRTTVDAVGKLLRASVIITAVLVVMQTLGYSVSGILAFGGIGGVAVGFAAKDLLANFFGGLMVYLDRPFAVGDWIRSPDRDIEGTVEEIGWRLTIIRTFDKRPLYLPNSTFTSIAVENPSRMSNRRIYETIGIRYDDLDKMSVIVEDVKKLLLAHPDIDTDQTMIVNFNRFSESSLDFFVYTFTRTINWVEFHEVKQDVLLKISEIIARHGAEIAYPTQTVHLADSLPSPEPDAAR
ncbi:MAG: mechanosensitive ion channel protein MscS [Acidithiobacillales bacterium SG8_45]|jgi:MscS family membrane protein|nr:MAG: mechanosensitive ion channel protein MscS [Acidithiobacillales bacterium SG8_45]